ncbi:MAG: hypothetical protein D3909_09665, partial [Candidatus Electrothrix sp. ATG1]|nr:hypothetical protein [Candidatus Electrothrix sp. ATG1]
VLLIGPLKQATFPEQVSSPVVAELPLTKVCVTAADGPPWPWSDIDVEPDDRIALSLGLHMQAVALPDFQGSFDLLEDIEPDLRWYHTKDSPDVRARFAAVRQIFGHVVGQGHVGIP